MSYEVEELTIKVNPGEDISSMNNKLIQAALDHKCKVYAEHNGTMYTTSYRELLNSIYSESEV